MTKKLVTSDIDTPSPTITEKFFILTWL